MVVRHFLIHFIHSYLNSFMLLAIVGRWGRRKREEVLRYIVEMTAFRKKVQYTINSGPESLMIKGSILQLPQCGSKKKKPISWLLQKRMSLKMMVLDLCPADKYRIASSKCISI